MMMGSIAPGVTQDGIDALVKLLNDPAAALERIEQLKAAAEAATCAQDDADKSVLAAEDTLARLEEERAESNDLRETAQSLAKTNAETTLRLRALSGSLDAEEAKLADMAKVLDAKEARINQELIEGRTQIMNTESLRQQQHADRMKAANELGRTAAKLMEEAQGVKTQYERKLAAMRQVVG